MASWQPLSEPLESGLEAVDYSERRGGVDCPTLATIQFNVPKPGMNYLSSNIESNITSPCRTRNSRTPVLRERLPRRFSMGGSGLMAVLTSSISRFRVRVLPFIQRGSP